MTNAMLVCASEWSGPRHAAEDKTQFPAESKRYSEEKLADGRSQTLAPSLPRARLDTRCRRVSGKTTGSSVRIWERPLFVVALLSRVPP